MGPYDNKLIILLSNEYIEKVRMLYKLLSLNAVFLQPFWPMGTGCARGFLGVFDAAWMILNWSKGEMTPLEIIVERESIYSLLSQTTPERVIKDYEKYSIDPKTRYLS